jgi:lipoate-protein ligase A
MASPSFRWIRSGPLPGPLNMALDEALSAGPSPVPTVRVYGWDPWTLSLGWFQRAAPVDLEPFLRAGFDATRRATGGGAILHADEITYSVILPAGDPRIPRPAAASYDWLHDALREALGTVGVAAAQRGPGREGAGAGPFYCFARTAPIDLAARGRKIAGSAQRRSRTAFLQHGSLPLSPNGTAPGATSVAEESGGRAPDRAALEEALGRAFSRILGAEAVPGAPTAEEEAAARALVESKYGNPAWVLHPWKGKGRTDAPGGKSPAADPLPDPIRVLRAEVAPGGLRVLAAEGGSREVFPHERLRAADAGLVVRIEERALAVERDPWDSTFRRSHFEATAGGPGPEGLPPVRASVSETEAAVALLYGDPPALLRVDARRFNFADLGDRRTGDWTRDARTWIEDLLVRSPSAARGPGACAVLAGAPPPSLPGEGMLLARVQLLGSRAPA